MGKKKKKSLKKKMKCNLIGCVTAEGIEYEEHIYHFQTAYQITTEPQALFALSSWARQDIKDFIGRKVIFCSNKLGQAYNIGILNKKGDRIIKI